MISHKIWAKFGLVGLPFFKCDEMRLSWVFTVQIAVIVVWKISLNSCLIGLDQLYTDRVSRSSREKDLNCFVPRRLSLDENGRAKEGGKETKCNGRDGASPAVCTLPMVPCGSHQSLAFRARLYDEKNEAPEEEAGIWKLGWFINRTGT